MWVLTMTQVRLQWHPSAAGGVRKVGVYTRKPLIFSLQPMAAEVMVRDCVYGNWSYKSFRMKPGSHFQFVTSLRAPANGTRSNTDCFPSSHLIGEVNH